MNERIYLEEKFETFLLNFKKLKSGTVESYLGSLRSHIHLVPEFDSENIETIIKNEDFESLIKIELPKYKKSFNIKKGTFENFSTHCKNYIKFIIYQIEQNLSKNTFVEDKINIELNEDNSDLIVEAEFFQIEEKDSFSSDFIFSNFEFRLISQNRFNKCGLFFPISFLKQYFYKTGDKQYFDKHIKKKINRIKLIHEDEKFYKFSDIEKIIKDKENKLHFTINGKNIALLSYCTETEKYEKFTIEKFSDIAIDHKISMNTILNKISNDKNNEFQQLQTVSNELKKFLKKPLTYKKLIAKGTKLSDNVDFVNSIDKEKLKTEFEMIIEKMDLQLMHKKHNNFKRAKD